MFPVQNAKFLLMLVWPHSVNIGKLHLQSNHSGMIYLTSIFSENVTKLYHVQCGSGSHKLTLSYV